MAEDWQLGAMAVLALPVVAAATVLAASAWAAGQRLAAAWPDPAALPGPFRFALGLVAWAQACWWLARVGWLVPGVLFAAICALHLWAWRDWLACGRACARACAGARGWGRAGGRLVLLACLLLPIGMLALYPPLGFDQTLYHLPFAQAFAKTGALPLLPDLRFPVFPQLFETLAAALLLLAGELATQTLGLVALVATLALTVTWWREHDPTALAGDWAVAIVLGSPCAVYMAVCGYVEPLLALAALAATLAADRSRDNPAWAWLAAAGVLAGSAAAIKYHGLYFVGTTALVLTVWGQPWRETWRRWLIYGAAVALTAGPTYLRLLLATGNPLYPFYGQVFGEDAWAADAFRNPQGVERPTAALTLLWDITFRRELVGHMPPFTPALVLGLPLALIAARSSPRLRRLFWIALLYLLASPTNAHYMVTILPFWGLLIGGGIVASSRFWPAQWASQARWAIGGLAFLVALGGPVYAGYQLHRLGSPPLSPTARSNFLASQFPLYRALAAVEPMARGGRVYGAGTERFVAYFDFTLMGDHNGPANYRETLARARERGLATVLDELGSRHLVVDRQLYGELLSLALGDPRLEVVYSDPAAMAFRVLLSARPLG